MEKKVPALFDGKDLIDDDLLDVVFQNCYLAADMKGGRSHIIGHVEVDSYDKDGIYLDAIVDAQWSASSNTIRIELLACPCAEDFHSMRHDFFRHFECVFREWEEGLKQNCIEPDSAEVEFKREGNVLYVSFWWLSA